MRLNRITSGLAAALVLLAGIAGVPALLMAIGAAPTSLPSPGQLRAVLLSSDQNMAVVFAVLAVVVWFCWAAFTLLTLREIGTAIATRGRSSARPLPKMEWVGRPAAQLVAAVVLVFVAAPGLISATTPTAASPVVAAAAPRSATRNDEGTSSARTNAPTFTAVAYVAQTPATPVRQGGPIAASSQRRMKSATYTVQRRDTLWNIA